MNVHLLFAQAHFCVQTNPSELDVLTYHFRDGLRLRFQKFAFVINLLLGLYGSIMLLESRSRLRDSKYDEVLQFCATYSDFYMSD
jgi:hypothetical protein